MKRHFFEISYRGDGFNGWQRQKNTELTIQQHIEEKLSDILRHEIALVACGRTDKGVHAKQFFFHCSIEWDQLESLTHKMNRMLNAHITVHRIFEVEENKHARFSAISRTYEYYFHVGKNPFLENLSLSLDERPNFEKVKEALYVISRHEDFRNFCKTPDKHRSTICKILSPPNLEIISPDRFLVRIKANRFLKSMIRILLYYVLEVGFGRLSLKSFSALFDSKESVTQIQMIGPDGLYLTNISYNFKF